MEESRSKRLLHETRSSTRAKAQGRAQSWLKLLGEMGKETLDFLQEMVRHKTTTKTTQHEAMPFCDCASALNEAMSGEPDQPPPKSSHKSYGDTGEGLQKEVNSVANSGDNGEGPPKEANSVAPAPPIRVYDFDFFGNPIEKKQYKPPPTQLFSPTHRFSVKEDCSESMMVPPENERKVDEAIRKEVIRHMNTKPGFMGGLANFLSCANPDDAESTVAKDIGNDAKLSTLFSSIKNAKTRRTLLEFELQSQLNELRRQNLEMEESYKQQIAAELSQKAILQAQLQAKLIQMVEGRMTVEMQLERMNSRNGFLRLPMAVGTPDDGEESPSSTITTPASTTRTPACDIDPVSGNLAQAMSSAKGLQPSGAPRSRLASLKDSFGLAVVIENQSSQIEVDSPVSAIAGSPIDLTGKSKSCAALVIAPDAEPVDSGPLPVATPVSAE